MNATRERLIDAAFQLFGREGFHGVGLDHIISEAGVSKQTFYNHFQSKDDLVLAVLEHRHSMETTLFQRTLFDLAGRDPVACLYCVFDALNEWFQSPEWRGCIFITAAAEFPLPHDPAHEAARLHVIGVREQIEHLAKLAGASAPQQLAEQLTLLFEGVLVYQHVTRDPRSIAIAREVARHLIDEQLGRTRQADPIPVPT